MEPASMDTTTTSLEKEVDTLREEADLYIDFAEAVSKKTGRPLEDVLLNYTPLYARFGIVPKQPDSDNPVWKEFIEGIKNLDDEDLKNYVYDFFKKRQEVKKTLNLNPNKIKPPGSCFQYEIKGSKVKLHFSNEDKSGYGPLSKERESVRLAELKNIFTDIKLNHHEVETVQGGSWLYNIDAYKRLFPSSYTAKPTPAEDNGTAHIFAYWGQLFDSEGHIKQEERENLFRKLESVDPSEIASAFQFQPLEVSAPIEDFYEKYGITDAEAPQS